MITSEDYKFLKIAEKISQNATCGILYVGCLIVKNEKIISEGWNAAIEGYAPCEEAGHVMNDEGRCMRQIHAETNAILNALKNGHKDEIEGATAYVTLEPCDNCTKLLNQCGIKRVVFTKRFPNPFNQHFIEPMEWLCLEDIEDK